jgi:PAS domain S-box-containing protein
MNPSIGQPDIEAFARSVDDARRRAQASIATTQRSSDAAAPVLADAPEPLSRQLLDSIEELQVAEEELRVQNLALVEAHETLEQERREYRVLFEGAPRPFIVTDLAGTIRMINRAGAALLGASPEVLHGKPLAAYVALDDRHHFRQELHAIASADLTRLEPAIETRVTIAPRGGGSIDTVASVRRIVNPRSDAGTLLWILPEATSADAEVAANAVQHVAGANREALGELRRVNEELREANRETLALLHREQRLRRALERAEGAKAHFFTVLSHELRTPLQAIVGYTELLAREIDGSMSATQREFLRRIEQSERHLLGLVNNVLDFERMTRGTPVQVEVGPVPVREVLDAIQTMGSTLAAEKDITLDVDCSDATLTAAGDRAMVQQVLVNLVTNAIKFTPPGGRVEVDAHRRDDGTIAIAVCDTGRGIPREKLERIFEPFVQVAADDTRYGSGLGLAISRNIAQALGGELLAESETGKGSRFTLTLPAHTPHGVGDAPQRAGRTRSRSAKSKE